MIDARQYVIGKYKPFDFETITVSSTAIGLTASKYNVSPKPKKVFITAETNLCRYRMDGTDPTGSVGHLLLPTSSLTLEGTEQFENVKFIRTGSDATLQVTYLR